MAIDHYEQKLKRTQADLEYNWRRYNEYDGTVNDHHKHNYTRNINVHNAKIAEYMVVLEGLERKLKELS
jgi:hypothetical protein